MSLLTRMSFGLRHWMNRKVMTDWPNEINSMFPVWTKNSISGRWSQQKPPFSKWSILWLPLCKQSMVGSETGNRIFILFSLMRWQWWCVLVWWVLWVWSVNMCFNCVNMFVQYNYGCTVCACVSWRDFAVVLFHVYEETWINTTAKSLKYVLDACVWLWVWML